jgi:uncharacterized protein YegL
LKSQVFWLLLKDFSGRMGSSASQNRAIEDGLMQFTKKALQNSRAFRFSSIVVCLAGNYARRTWTFFALSDFKLNLLAFIE